MTGLAIGAVLLLFLFGRGGKKGEQKQAELTAAVLRAVNYQDSGATIPEQLEALELAWAANFDDAALDVAAAVHERIPTGQPGPVDPNVMAHITGLTIPEQIQSVEEFWAAGFNDAAHAVLELVEHRIEAGQ